MAFAQDGGIRVSETQGVLVSRGLLQEHQEQWRRKPALRAVYSDYYDRIVDNCVSGRTLEIGGGSGNLKERLPDVFCTDIVPMPWLDAAADAQSLPFGNDSFSNVVLIDVLHHIEWPARFFDEARRVLRPAGRLILLEPAITPMSWIIMKLFHSEPIVLSEDPFTETKSEESRQPFDANQAIPTMIFGRDFVRFAEMFPEFSVVRRERLSLFAYPLSGGFRPWCLIPSAAVKPLLQIENRVSRVLGPIMAFRLFIVLEHNG